MTTEVIQPLIKAIALDVTEHCNGLPPLIDRVLDVYVYDDNVNWHLCSFQKSIELWLAYLTWTPTRPDYTDEEAEAADEWVREAGFGQEDVIYMDRDSVESIARIPGRSETYGPCGPILTSDDTFQEISRELIEEAIDYYRGNPPW